MHLHHTRRSLVPVAALLIAGGCNANVFNAPGSQASYSSNPITSTQPSPTSGAPNPTNSPTGGPTTATPAPGPMPSPRPTVGTYTTGWLHTSGNQILHDDDNTVWVAHGINFFDTRSCGACLMTQPDTGAVLRLVDAMMDDWNAKLLRLNLESYATADGRTQWADATQDPNYANSILDIVEHIGAKGGFVEVSLSVDATIDANGWPTAATCAKWTKLAQLLAPYPWVMYGIVNEPSGNYTETQDPQVWTAMNNAVQAIRDGESAIGAHPHLVMVQGTGGWARYLNYYITHPITAGSGTNIVYEEHCYSPASGFATLWETPAQTLPVIISEYALVTDYMLQSDVDTMRSAAIARNVSTIAWAFHDNCGSAEFCNGCSMLETQSTANICQETFPIVPVSPWGNNVRDWLRSLP